MTDLRELTVPPAPELTPPDVRLKRWGLATAAVVFAMVAALLLIPQPDLSMVPNHATHLKQACAPKVGATAERAQVYRARVSVQGIACQTCAGGLLQAFEQVQGVCAAQIRVATSDMLVDYQPTVIDIEQVMNIATAAGFPAQAWTEGAPVAQQAVR